MTLTRRTLMTAIAASTIGSVLPAQILGKERPRVRFRAALTRVINKRLPPGTQRARIFNALARPLPGQSNRFGYAYVYGLCCTEMIDAGTVIENVIQSVKSLVIWLQENWDKVLKFLLSLILFL